MDSLVSKAFAFAAEKHLGQQRKYVRQPYITHPVDVAFTLVQYGYDKPEMLAAALLHDVIEDCDVTHAELDERFGREVADLVVELTQPDKLDAVLNKKNRAERHQAHIAKLKTISLNAKIIKAADRLCNLQDSPVLANSECINFIKNKYLDKSINV